MSGNSVKVYSPVRDYTGTTAGVDFVAGNGIIPDGPDQCRLVEWFRQHGYKIDAGVPKPAHEVPPVFDAAEQAKQDEADAYIKAANKATEAAKSKAAAKKASKPKKSAKK